MKAQFCTHHRLLACLLIPLMTVSCAKMQFLPVAPEQESSGVTTSPNKVINSTEIVSAGNKQVDFLLVLDDSNSMLPELKKLSARMATFVSFLEDSQIDWQMCVTTTRASKFGTYLSWKNYSPVGGAPSYVLKRGGGDLNTIFTSTIDSVTIGGGDSGDERAIKSAYVSFTNKGPCYRPGAAVSVIAISDEDERSVGGDPSKVKAKDAAGAYQPLEAEDLPLNLITRAQASFGTDVRFTFNSIIVKPGDLVCEAQQDVDTSPSHPAAIYSLMSTLSDGGIGSICDADYSTSLYTFKNRIVNSLSHLTLQCEPVQGSLKIWIDKIPVPVFKAEKKILKFAERLLEGTRIDLTYECQE